jgi:hypothetical protein
MTEATQKDANDCSFKMGMFHVKKGIPANLAHPEKVMLKNGICHDFCCRDRKCVKPHQVCKNSKHYTHWNKIPKEDRDVLLKHYNGSGNMWLDAKTFKKYNLKIPTEYAHRLGDARGPQGKKST